MIAMPNTLAILSLAGLIFSSVLMFLTWTIATRIQNAGIVDIAWSAGFLFLVMIYTIGSDGYLPRKLLILSMILFWSLRLSLYLAIRIARAHPREDARYQELRRKWQNHANRNFFYFFQFQALLLLLLSVPFILISLNDRTGLIWLEWMGLVLWAIAWIGETLADRQLYQFKSDPARKGQVCQTGLWRYSRHPNYFFEWLNWCAYFVFACGSPFGFIAIYCPVVMLFFLFKVTGIPVTEEQSLRTKGDAYRLYQKTTSAFVPWFRKKAQ